MAETVREVVAQIENSLLSSQGVSQQKTQKRLGDVVSILLEFWPEERVVNWMLKKNPGLRGEQPVDLVNSAYATQHLLSVIREMKLKNSAKKNNKTRLRRLLREPSVLQTGTHTPLREKLRGPMIDPGPPPEFPRDPNILE